MARRNWRGVSDKVAKEKAEIYNSREWKELTVLKKRANPLCEQCIKDGEAIGIPGGYVKSVECVHHIIPIETARTKEEMRRLAFDWNNLMSLCQSCHNRIHKELGSNTAKIVRQRAEARQDRWADNLMSKFVKQEDNGIQTEIHEGPVRETGADRNGETKAKTDSESNGGHQGDMG